MKTRLLSILALLLVAVSGAWAQDTYTVTFKANGNTVTVENVTLPKTFSCDYWTFNGVLDQIIKQLYGVSDGYCSPVAPTSSGSENVTCGLDVEGYSQIITISGPFDGTATVTGSYYDSNMGETFNYSLEITCPQSAPAAGFTASFTAANAYTIKGGKASVSVDGGIATLDEEGKLPDINEGLKVTITAKPGYKFRKVTAEKEAAPEPEPEGDFVTFTDGTNTVTVAKMNLGATSVADGTSSYGNYYAWGATTTSTEYIEANAPYYSGDTFTKYNATDNLTTLEAADDVVTATLGDEYRMPTKEDFQTLYAACGGTGDKIIDKLPTIEDGAEYNKGIYWVNATAEKPVKAGGDTYKANGVLFVQDADTHVFFPAAGYVDGLGNSGVGTMGNYWSSSRYAKWDFFDSGYNMNLGNDTVIPAVDAPRYLGFTVRPVQD